MVNLFFRLSRNATDMKAISCQVSVEVQSACKYCSDTLNEKFERIISAIHGIVLGSLD